MIKILALTYLFFGLMVTPQIDPDKGKLLSKAEEAFYNEDYKLALILYNDLEKNFPESTEHLYHKYIVEHLSDNRGGDLSKLLSMEVTKGQEDIYYEYWMGKIYMKRYEFDKASERFKSFLSKNIERSDMIEAEVQSLLRWIDQAKDWHSRPSDYQIESLAEGINTVDQELSPSFFKDFNQLVFISDRQSPDPNYEQSQYLAYQSIKTEGNWSSPTAIEEFPYFNFNKAKIEGIEDKTQLYFFVDPNSSLYYHNYEEGETWSAPLKLETKVKSKDVISHFYINQDITHIIYVTGSPYNHDIWQSKLVNGSWSSPQGIKEINSEFNEDSPFLSEDGKKLYFSSARPSGVGGYDIYVSNWNESDNKWGTPENLGFPINTMDDELYFEVLPNQDKGFFASNRLNSLGGFDLFYFYKDEKIILSGKVTNKETNLALVNATVTLNPKSNESKPFVTNTNDNGLFSLSINNRQEYSVEVSVNDDKVFEGNYSSKDSYSAEKLTLNIEASLPESVYIASKTTNTYPSNTSQSKENKGTESTPVNSASQKTTDLKGNVQGFVYFSVASAQLSEKSNKELMPIYEALAQNKNLKVFIAGHSDILGVEEFNTEISKRRAESVQNFLISKGISKDRISIKGYGSTKPMATNDVEENGRELNRRAEIIFIK
ncbi:MAG: outer membrane protein OmpA-like peptidoglycan-associated protein [Marinoscillum sp.]|jgi:outer membrane protein OmpA-like peptidoglycan-associated protein